MLSLIKPLPQVVESMDDVVYVGAIVQEANKIFIEEQTKEITTFCNHPGMENVPCVQSSNLQN